LAKAVTLAMPTMGMILAMLPLILAMPLPLQQQLEVMVAATPVTEEQAMQ